LKPGNSNSLFRSCNSKRKRNAIWKDDFAYETKKIRIKKRPDLEKSGRSY